jgi:hypothetical protein
LCRDYTARGFDGIDFGCGGAYAFWQLQKEPRGVLWPRRKLKSARIRVATARQRRAASIAAHIVKGLRAGRRLRATVITRNAPSKNLKHSSGNDYGGGCHRIKRSGFQVNDLAVVHA